MVSPSPTRMIRFHRFALSGHCHRVELLLSLLAVPFQRIEVDLGGGEHKSQRFLALNPFGQVPVIEDGERVIADSNAILVYLASSYGGARWLPDGPVQFAEQQRWFSVAAGPLAFGAAAARVQRLFGGPGDWDAAAARAQALFELMDEHLASRSFLLGERLTLADMANYAYVAHAPEGGVGLEPHASIRAWLARIENTPGFVPMLASAV
jgi:glutathione S-transferase